MQLYSTKNRNNLVSLKEAIMKSLPADRGLYMPDHIPTLSRDFITHIEQYTFEEIAFNVVSSVIGDEIELSKLRSIVEETVNFPAPLVKLDEDTHVLEHYNSGQRSRFSIRAKAGKNSTASTGSL